MRQFMHETTREKGIFFSTIGYVQGKITQFADWCERHYLDPNVKKTKEMVIDLKSEQKKSAVNACMIKGQEVERVNMYKY